jgi:hypothetical protein
MVVVRGFGGEGADLLVTPSVSGDEEDWHALDLRIVSKSPFAQREAHALVSSSKPPSRYKYNEYLVAKRVCSVSKSLNLEYVGRM